MQIASNNMKKPIVTLSRIAAILVILVYVPDRAAAQLVIQPMRIVISSDNPTREVTLRNDGNELLEVSTRMMFGIWRVDSASHLILDSTGTPQELSRACTDWVKVFPKQFTLAPGAMRKLRLLVTPPAGIPNGEYNSRLIVASSSVGLPTVSVPTSGDAITGTLKGILNMSLEVMFRKGTCETGIELQELRMNRSDALVDVRPLGNATYRGTLFGVVHTPDGATADSITYRVIAATPQRLKMSFRQLPAGSYRLMLESRAVLPGSAAETVIASPPVRKEYDLVVTATETSVTPRIE
jgi:hypothetical protein